MGTAIYALLVPALLFVPIHGNAQGLEPTLPPIQKGTPIPESEIQEQPIEKPEGAPSTQAEIYPPDPVEPSPTPSTSDATPGDRSPTASATDTPEPEGQQEDAPPSPETASSTESSSSTAPSTTESSSPESEPEADGTRSETAPEEPTTSDRPAEAQSLETPPPQSDASQTEPIEPPVTPPSPLLFDGDYLATVDRLRRELRLDPQATDKRFALGQALFGLGEVDEALDEYRLVLEERPNSISARLHVATALMAKRRWKEAKKELTDIIALDDKVVAAHHNLAAVRYSLGDVRGAIESYRAALALAPDSVETHYHLGLVLRLAGRAKDAVPEFQAAAEAGHPKAQYFLGTAFSAGTGVDRDLAMAIRWWMVASEQGVPEARDALSRLRKTALKSSGGKTPNKTMKAFESYRNDLWFAFPELTPNGNEETVGIALLQAFRVDEAVPTLIREATALGELSERYLAALYEQGLPTYLEPNDARILRYFEMAAGDGAPQARLSLARIHALGLGVPADRGKALAILKGLPKAYAEQFLKDLADNPAGTPPHTVPQPGEASPAAPHP